MKKALALLLTFSAFFLQNCGSDAYKKQQENPEYIHSSVKRLTDIIRHDIFPPPVSSRIYAYSSVACYEALIPGYPDYRSLAGQLQGLKPAPQPEAGKEYCFPLASANAMLIVGKALVFSESEVEEEKDEVFGRFEAMKMPKDVFERSMKYGETVAKHILAWSKQDNYAQLRTAPKFTITTDNPARWKPTPPVYADALEPHWGKIRPWVLDSSSQVKAGEPQPFSTQKTSKFYQEAENVLKIGKSLTEEQSATAWYWDDNPAATQVVGHVSFTRKKISPGGHWMNITAHACRKAKKSPVESAEAYVYTALALADGFIGCWQEKYRHNLVRPETVINQYMDANWHPLIQTPPFPEHPSGHSTISMASATVLSSIFGENFAFSDSTETEFGLPSRDFSSFKEAARQAGESRIFGGIHFKTGCESGLEQGEKIGQFILQKIKTRKK
jgi:hypothetical protein